MFVNFKICDLIVKINLMIIDSLSLKRMFGLSEKGVIKVCKISNWYICKVFFNKFVEFGKLFWFGYG